MSTSDTTPPVLAGFDFTPKQVDTTSSNATITFTAHVTDNLSGATDGWVVTAMIPTAQQTASARMDRTSGTALDGIYEGVLTLPAHSETGTWTIIYLWLGDSTGNGRYFFANDPQVLGSASLSLLDALPISTPPVLAGFDFTPKQVDTTSSNATITFTAHVTDNLSG